MVDKSGAPKVRKMTSKDLDAIVAIDTTTQEPFLSFGGEEAALSRAFILSRK